MPSELCSVCGCPNRPWLKVGTVAVALGLSGRHIRNLLASGTLHGRKLGARCWRIEHPSVDAYARRADNRADEGVIPATTPQETAA